MPKRKQYADEAHKALPPEERHLCAFTAYGRNCPEAGTMTDATVGPGSGQADTRQWLCRWHFPVKGDFEGGARILDDLIGHKQSPAENWRDRLVREHIENNRNDPLMARALMIAEGKGDDQDKADLLKDLRQRLGSFVDRVKV